PGRMDGRGADEGGGAPAVPRDGLPRPRAGPLRRAEPHAGAACERLRHDRGAMTLPGRARAFPVSGNLRRQARVLSRLPVEETAMTHIVETLREDHQRMATLFQRILQQTNGGVERRGELARALGRELSAHANFK